MAHTVYFRAPLYYYFLAGIYRVFGHSLTAARIVHSLLGAVSVVLCYRLGCRLFRPSVALAAAVAMAFYAPLIFAVNELHTTVLELLLDLTFLLLVTKSFSAPVRERLLLAASAGVVLGLSVITRPNILVALPIFAFAIWWSAVRTASGDPVSVRRSETGFTLTFFLLCSSIAPLFVTARNYFIAGDPVFVASQGGINLFLGNRPGADGFTPATPERYAYSTPYEDSVALYGQRAADDAVGRSLSAGESQQYWIGQVTQWWRAHPADALVLLGKKWTLAWTHREIRNNTAFDYVRREWAPILYGCPIGWGIAAPLALIGMAVAWWREPKSRPFALFVFAYMFSFALFFAADRFRLPVVPLVLHFAAYAIEESLPLLRRAVRGTPAACKELSFGCAALMIVGIWVNVDWYTTVTSATRALDYWSAANRYIALHRFAEAEAQTNTALSLDAANPEIWNTRGESEYYQSHFADAEQSFARAIRLSPKNAGSFYNLALCKIAQGQVAEARPLLRIALRLDPYHTSARNELLNSSH